MATDPDSRHSDGGIVDRISDGFSVAIEVETSRGLAMEAGARHSLELATEAADGGRVDAVCFTDNPGGNPHITPETLGRELLERDIEVVNQSFVQGLQPQLVGRSSVGAIQLGVRQRLVPFRRLSGIGIFRTG